MGRPRLARARDREFWLALRVSSSPEQAAARVGVSATTGRSWITEAGGVAPDLGSPSGRYLSLAERVEIDLGLADGLTQAEIARRLGRARSTISREVTQRSTPPRIPRRRGHYRAATAHQHAEDTARRPKHTRLAQRPALAVLGQDVGDRAVAGHARAGLLIEGEPPVGVWLV